jgi:molybdenum cofactor cytidylyltransferase
MVKKTGCIIMASGQSVRFGSNKLLAEFAGKTLIQRILDITDGVFDERVVLTRTKEVEQLCSEQGIDVILHEYPYRNQAVRIGIEHMEEMDGVVFCPSDQPMLSRETLMHMKEVFKEENHELLRACAGDKQGAPVLFGKKYFEELKQLTEKKGGSYLLKKYPNCIRLVEVDDERELFDIDTGEDFERLLSII